MFLLLAIFLPALGIIVASGLSQRQEAIGKAQNKAILIVRSLAAQQEQIAISTQTMLSTLAQLPEVQNLDAPACNRLFRDLQEKYPFYSVILAAKPNGDVFAVSLPFKPFSIADRKYFQDALSSLAFSTGEYIVGRVSKVTSIHYSFPVFDAQKKLVAVLVAGFKLNEFSGFISKANLPTGSAVVLMDHKGLRLYRSPQNEATPIGKPVLKGFFEPVSGRAEEGLFEWKAADGVKRINAFKQLRVKENLPPYMYILVGQPKDKVLSAANWQMWRNLLILGLATLLALSLAWRLGNTFLIKPIDQLVAAAQQFGRGRMDTRTGLPHTSDELGRLAQSFDDMAALLETRNQEREDRFRSLFEHMAEGVALHELVYDDRGQAVDYRIISTNPSFEKHTGVKQDQICGQLASTAYGTGAAPYLEIYGPVAQSGQPYSFETFFPPLQRHFHISATSPKQGQFVTVFEDITERKRIEEIFKLNELRLEALLRLNQMAAAPLREIASFALEEAIKLTGSTIGYLAFVNETESVLTMHAWSENSIAECRIVDKPLVYPVEATGLWGEAIRQRKAVITNDYAAPNPWKKGCPEGHLKIMKHMNAPIFDGNKIVMVAGVGNKPGDYDESDVRQLTLLMEGMWRIIQRNRAEEALRNNEQFLTDTFNCIQDGICILDPDLNIIRVNPAMEKLGYSQPIVGRKCYEVYHNQNSPCENCPTLETLVTGKSSRRVVKGHPANPSEQFIEVLTYPLKDQASGQIRAVIEYVRDITEHKQAEDERLRFSKMESISTLAGGIAHDFNNILTAIMGNISLAMLDDQKPNPGRERLDAAERACSQAQSLARQLLTFAKGGTPIKEPVSLEKLITDSASFATSGSQVKCNFTFSPHLWAAEADKGQIGQVFQNLVINAIQAMPAGGMINIHGENLLVEKESDLPLAPGRYCKISIQDQGTGIPADFLAKIFDPYFTTKQSGSGLGLSTVYSIVKKHEGHISVESKLGRGTTFHIFLPAVDRKITEEPQEERVVSRGQGKILVMDDEAILRELLGNMLGSLGYQAILSKDGNEAVTRFNNAKKFGEKIDAVILDLTIPGGMGGKATIEKLLVIDPEVKAIVSSGYSEDPIMADYQNYGFCGVIAKPYRISELNKVLNNTIKKYD